MKTQSEHVQRWEDIIFENRNKEYGAYAIRKNYDDRVLTGWTISLGVVGLIFLSSFLSGEGPVITTVAGPTCVYPMPKPDIIPDRKITPTAPAPKQLNKNLPPVVTPKDVPDPVDPVKPADPTTSGGTGDTGTPNNGEVQSGGTDINVPVDITPTLPYVLAPEVMPMYEGGMEAMMKFLQKKMRYPKIAVQNREEGTVFVSFIISSTGEVTNIEVVRGISKSCDQEAIRVVSMMSKWKPGLQNKMPVAVKMVLPIKFKLDI